MPLRCLSARLRMLTSLMCEAALYSIYHIGRMRRRSTGQRAR
jgi:hypothetical protein